jgi:hypothetical protein
MKHSAKYKNIKEKKQGGGKTSNSNFERGEHKNFNQIKPNNNFLLIFDASCKFPRGL